MVAKTIIVIAVKNIKISAKMYVNANFSILLTRHKGAVTMNTKIPIKLIEQIETLLPM